MIFGMADDGLISVHKFFAKVCVCIQEFFRHSLGEVFLSDEVEKDHAGLSILSCEHADESADRDDEHAVQFAEIGPVRDGHVEGHRSEVLQDLVAGGYDGFYFIRAYFVEIQWEWRYHVVRDITKIAKMIYFQYMNKIDDECYGFSWVGQRQAREEADRPGVGILQPWQAESRDWEGTRNVFIEGDNLEVLKLLQERHATEDSRAKLIYIDPPYNTGNDFVYKDSYRRHSDWLNMMYPRLRLAHGLLREDGVIFISIDDHEVCHLRFICNEIFGEENFISQIVVRSNKRGQTYRDIAKTHEYLLVYSKSDRYSLFEVEKEEALPFEDRLGKFDLWELRNRNPRFGRHNRPNLFYPFYVSETETDPNGFHKVSLSKSSGFDIEVFPRNSKGKDSCWRWSQEKISKEDISSDVPVLVAKRKRGDGWNVYEKARKSTTSVKSIWDDVSMISEQGTIELGALGLEGIFDHPKPLALISQVVRVATHGDDLVVDFFAGSGTTAHAVMKVNAEDGGARRFLCVQWPEATAVRSEAFKAGYHTIADITRERIRRAGERIAIDHERAVDTGFRVYRLSDGNGSEG